MSVPMPVLEVLPLIEDIRISRVKGKTLFEMGDLDSELSYICNAKQFEGERNERHRD